MNNFLTLILTTSLYLCLDIQNSISVGYEDNFLRFSDLEMNSNLFENGTSNDYMGDSRFFDSSIISPSTQLTYHSKLNDYKTKTIIRFKFNEYQSSNQKSYFNLNARYESRATSAAQSISSASTAARRILSPDAASTSTQSNTCISTSFFSYL